MKLILHTQVHENYSAHDWDGTGECPQYWKAKGGEDYEVKGLVDLSCEAQSNSNLASPSVRLLVQEATKLIEQSSNYLRERVIGWQIVPDNYLTESEKLQLEYEGTIRWPRHKIIVT